MITHRKRRSPRDDANTSLFRSLRHEAGTSAIEFALIVPFLLMLAGGIVEMANVFFVRSQLNEIVRDATRRLAVDAFDQDAAHKFIVSKLAQTTKAKGNITFSETDKKGEEPTDVTVSLSIPLKDVLIFDLIAESFIGSKGKAPHLSVAATMLKH